MSDVIVVGGGAAAAAAALELAERGLRPLVLDVGYAPDAPGSPIDENLYAFRRHRDSFTLHIGAGFQGLAGLLGMRGANVKLNAPNMEYVTRNADVHSPVDGHDFDPVQSFAAGGLGNAWGAGLYRFCDEDLDGFPIKLADLDPYFDRLTREIGIAGTEDDLRRFFGTTAGLLPPVPFSHNIGRLYRGYEKHRARMHREGVFVGSRAGRGSHASPRRTPRPSIAEPGVLAGDTVHLFAPVHTGEVEQGGHHRLPARHAGGILDGIE